MATPAEAIWLLDLGQTDTLVFYIFCGVAGLILLLSLGVVVASCLSGSKAPAASMDFNIILGGLPLAASVLIRGTSTLWMRRDEMDALCKCYPAILLVGLTFFIGGLLIKVCGIFHYTRIEGKSSAMKNEWKANLWMFLLIIIIAAAVIVWAFFWPQKLSQDVGGVNGQTAWQCFGTYQDLWQLALSVYHGALLLLAAIISICAACKTRSMPAGIEARATTFVIWNTVAAVVTSIILVYIYEPPQESRGTITYAIHGGLLLYTVFFADLAILCGRMLAHNRSPSYRDSGHYEEPKGSTIRSSSRGSGSNFDVARNSKQDEYFNY